MSDTATEHRPETFSNPRLIEGIRRDGIPV